MQELGIFFVATLFISGVMPGVFQALHKVFGYSNSYVGEDSGGYIDIGSVPLFILKIGVGSLIGGMIVSEGLSSREQYSTLIVGILIGGGLACIHSMIVWFLASAHRFSYGLIGAGIGLLFGVIIGTIGSDLFLFRREALATIFGIVSSAGGTIFGGVLGIRNGQFSSSRLAAEIAGTMILGRGIGGLMMIFCEGEIGEVIFIVSSYALLGELLGGGVVIILIMVATLSRVIFIGSSFLLILIRFKIIICSTCLRYTQPLKSQCNAGIRYCENCHTEVEQTSEPGKVIFLFGQFSEFQGQNFQSGDKRRFIILNPTFGDTQQKPENGLFFRSTVDLDREERPVDVSEVYIDIKTSDQRLIERFITYIINYPPAGGIGSVQIFYRGKMTDLGDNLNNALRNNFVYLERV
jgi:hypothetical protein